MVAEHISTHRQLITLKDGVRVLLRPLTKEDADRLVALFAPVTQDDAKYVRDPVTDPVVVRRWAEELDYSHVLPLVAVVHDHVVGDLTLHFGEGPSRHLGELRIFLAKDYRRRGLGTAMLRNAVDLARRAGLHQLFAYVVADQTRVIKAFESSGFEAQCRYEDFFMFPDGEMTDLVMLTMRLVPREEEF